jgi:hypothetical protein
MGTWFWLNIPLMLLFLGCWAAIPMWHTFRRWDAELKAKHAELAARGVLEPALVRSAAVAAAYRTTASLATPAISVIPDQSSRRVEPSVPVIREVTEDERPSRY